MSLLEMTELLSLPIVLVAGFVLVVVVALLMVILRKETTYEDLKRERDRKLGDSSEGGQEKNLKPSKKKVAHKPKKVESALSPQQPQSDPSVSETNTSEEEITPAIPPNQTSPKLPAKSKKNKQKQPLETSSLPANYASVEEITVLPDQLTESAVPPVQVSESLPPDLPDNPSDGFSEVSGKKKNRSKTKKLKEEVPVSHQNGDINWSETNGHDSDQVLLLTSQLGKVTSQLDKVTAENNEVIRSYGDLSGEVQMKNSEIQKLQQKLQAKTLSSDQEMSNLRRECGRLKGASSAQTQATAGMQAELDRRKTIIDTLQTQKTNFDTQIQQLNATIDKKEVERARILHDRDATQSELDKVNASVAELTSNCKKLEKQLRESTANAAPDAALERSLTEKTAALLTVQSSLELAERAAAEKEKESLESENERRVRISYLERELSEREREVGEAHARVNAYESKIEELTREVNDWEETVSSLTGEMSSLRTDSSSVEDVDELRREVSQKEGEIERLTSLIESAQEELGSIGAIRSEFEALKERQREEIQFERESASPIQDSGVEPIAKLVSSHAILQASLSQYEGALEESQKDSQEMKNDLEGFEKKFEEKDSELQVSKDENKVIQETLDKFKKKNNELRESVWKMKDALRESENSAEKETKAIHFKVEDFLAEVFPDIREHGEDFYDWLEKMKNSAKSHYSKLAENVSVSEGDSGLRDKVKELTDREETLKSTIRDTEEDVLLLQSQVEEEFEQLRGSLNSEQQAGREKLAIIGERESELSESVKQCESLTQENATLKGDVVPELEKRLKDKEGKIHELTYHVDSISQKSAKLEDELASSMRQSLDQEERTSSLQAENLSLFGLSEINQNYKKELAEAKELIRALQANSATNQSDSEEANRMKGVREELESLKQENDTLQQQLREMKTMSEPAANVNNNNATEPVKPKKTSKSPKLFKKKTPTTEL